MRRYIESASGIREGGRTGLTALTVCFYFFVSLFFSPLLGASLLCCLLHVVSPCVCTCRLPITGDNRLRMLPSSCAICLRWSDPRLSLHTRHFASISVPLCCATANIPPYAVGPALLIVGSLMVANVAKIPWDRIGQAIPAFITLALMPLTYSIAYGAFGEMLAAAVAYGCCTGALKAVQL